MPIITIDVTGKPDPALSARIAATISGLTRIHLKKDPAITSVAVRYTEPQHWFGGGQSLADRDLATFWLDIKVVDGTNTKQETAAWLGAVYEAMDGLLGGVHEESYALVHEVPASAYGFGGLTQERRFIAGQLAAE